MQQFTLREISHGTPDYFATVDLRNVVLREPLGMKLTADEIDAERTDIHLACYRGELLVGCLVLVPRSGGEIKMRQVAVSPEAQGQGVGRVLVGFAEGISHQRGFVQMTLHARESAVLFYEKLGYSRVGERFTKVTLPHWQMRKRLGEVAEEN